MRWRQQHALLARCVCVLVMGCTALAGVAAFCLCWNTTMKRSAVSANTRIGMHCLCVTASCGDSLACDGTCFHSWSEAALQVWAAGDTYSYSEAAAVLCSAV
jgi:hypothetical protein